MKTIEVYDNDYELLKAKARMNDMTIADIVEDYCYLHHPKHSTYIPVINRLLETKSIPYVVGYIYNLFQNYEIDEDEEEYLYKLADPEERFNSPSKYDIDGLEEDGREDFSPEEIAAWDEKGGA